MLQRPPHSCANVVSWLRRLRLTEAVAIGVDLNAGLSFQVYLVQQARRANGWYYSDVSKFAGENQRVVSILLFLIG